MVELLVYGFAVLPALVFVLLGQGPPKTKTDLTNQARNFRLEVRPGAYAVCLAGALNCTAAPDGSAIGELPGTPMPGPCLAPGSQMAVGTARLWFDPAGALYVCRIPTPGAIPRWARIALTTESW